MKRRAWLVIGLATLVAGCETTGNPREGGLFGWSEAKAQQRVAERRERVAAADSQLAEAQRQSTTAQAHVAEVSRDEANAARTRDRQTHALEDREKIVSEKAAQLEAASPTPASVSRARRLRLAVETARLDAHLSPAERARELHRLEGEIDAARAKLSR